MMQAPALNHWTTNHDRLLRDPVRTPAALQTDGQPDGLHVPHVPRLDVPGVLRGIVEVRSTGRRALALLHEGDVRVVLRRHHRGARGHRRSATLGLTGDDLRVVHEGREPRGREQAVHPLVLGDAGIHHLPPRLGQEAVRRPLSGRARPVGLARQGERHCPRLDHVGGLRHRVDDDLVLTTAARPADVAGQDRPLRLVVLLLLRNRHEVRRCVEPQNRFGRLVVLVRNRHLGPGEPAPSPRSCRTP